MSSTRRLNFVSNRFRRAGWPMAGLFCAAGLCSALSMPLPAHAAGPLVIGGPRPAAMSDESHRDRDEELKSLRDAYRLMAGADQNYDGFRVRAMGSVERACNVLGMDIRGDGRGGVPQHYSDAELRKAKEIIEIVREKADHHQQDALVEHLDGAIRHLKSALHIK